MSDNIDTWKTKRLEKLTLPLDALYKHERADWHPDEMVIEDKDIMSVRLECGCGQTIKGILKDGVLKISELDMDGEGSGTFFHWILEPALKESKGILEAVLIWEGGDSITRLVVQDGKVTHESIEL